ncbi:hypothetical protein [Mucilaginibacter pedocola]|uniref:Uncharacterized protein n=1 Tax=Mucilaginibacter pedocola TaxID=1792845 RepID=A0A1S9PDE6_9SPHI|nr:hypothetical protein [Mucilaginibacter pedocola]OOQ59002.1 hypothetical protein BC343_30035 [Mucilaginibacter pedocola]
MKIGFRLFLIVTAIFSFFLGMPKPAFETETALALSFTNGAADIFTSALIFVMLVSHVLLLFLVFMRQSLEYRYFLFYFPIVFWLMYMANTITDHLAQPDMFLSHIPYLLCYALTVFQYNSILKIDPDFALGPKPEIEDEPGLPRQQFDTREPM